MDDLAFLFGFVCLIAVSFYTAFFVWVGNNSPTGPSTTNWNDIKSNLFSSWISPLLAIVFTFFASAYFIRFPDYSVYLAMAFACLGVGIALASLSFAIVSR
jgi:hypothetical protein